MSQIPELVGGNALTHGISMFVDHGGASGSKMSVGGQAKAITAAVPVDGTNSTNAHYMMDKYIIPANTLVAGSTVRVRAVGRVAGIDGTPNLQAFVSLGASAGTPASNNQLLTTTDAASIVGDFWVIDGTIQFRTVGTTATGYAMFSYCDPADQATKRAIATTISATAAVNTTADVFLSVDLQWSASHADNDATLEMFIVDVVNPNT
jgi:hypothetical protein